MRSTSSICKWKPSTPVWGTPEYPAGTYAYFVTIDEEQHPVFPYVLGPKFFGKVQPGNTGPNSGYNVITEPVTVFTSVNDEQDNIVFSIFPNPASEWLKLFLVPGFQSNLTARLLDARGQVVQQLANIQTGVNYTLEVGSLPAGMYVLQISDGRNMTARKVAVVR